MKHSGLLSQPQTLRRKTTIALVVLVIVLAAGGGALLFARLFLVKMSILPTGGMKNTIIPGDQILTFKLFGTPERGSIVIFQYPPGTSDRDPEGTASYVARIVGLPGETIQLRGDTVYINERPLDEIKVLAREDEDLGALTVVSTEGQGPYQVFYLEDAVEAPDDFRFGTTTPFPIPADNYFLLGDHRDNSVDSRSRISWLYVVLVPLVYLVTILAFRKEEKDAHVREQNREIVEQMFTIPVLFGETLIVKATRI
ncbi:MAG TPA: signal peptidase I [Pyrinomonadaceae bacterium]|nr:signal peptidase I [Pyrinomonadaceae bacterium]